jgi:HK97 gp10 family phage protein
MILGIKELINDLNKLEKSINSKTKEIVKEATEPVLQAAVAYAPEKTGALYKSLTFKLERSNKPGKKMYALKSKKNKAVDGKGNSYLSYVEYGRKGKNGIVPPANFASNALNDKKERVEKQMTDQIISEFESIMGGGNSVN